MSTDKTQSVDDWEELAEYLFELANTIHEHRDMLFHLSDEAKAQAERARRQTAATNSP